MAFDKPPAAERNDTHEGHRSRLKARAWEDGLLSLPKHEVMELILYYAVPRRDMNETAHRLIDAFKSVRGVLEAPYEELIKVEGVGDKVARLIGAISKAVDAYLSLPAALMPVIRTRRDAVEYAQRLFEGDKRAQTWIALVNSGGSVSYETRLRTGAKWYNDDIRRFIAERALQHDAHEVIIVSRKGVDMPSPLFSDKQALLELARCLEAIDVYIMDYLIVGPTKTVSMRQILNIGITRIERGNLINSTNEDWTSEYDGVFDTDDFEAFE